MTDYTYSQILSQMKDEYKAKSGSDADDASDIGIRLRLLAGQLYALSTNISFIQRQLFAGTATGDYLDMHAAMRGIDRVQPTKAHGKVRFSKTAAAAADITIPQGTICTTSGSNDVQYATAGEVTLQAGNTYADAEVEALQGGSGGNAAAGALTVMINAPQGIDSVSNTEPVTGGSPAESDESLRLRIQKSYREMSNGANATYYIEKVLENPNVISANVISGARGAGTIDVVFDTAERDETAVAQLEGTLTAQLLSSREIGIDVIARCCDYISMNVTLHIKVDKDYSESGLIAQCQSVAEDYFDSLQVGEDLILSQLGNRIFVLQGIENYHITAPAEDTSVSGGSKVILNNLTVLNVL